MKINIVSTALFACVAVLAGCAKDNYEPPKSQLSGRVVYQGQPVGVRSNGVQLELWQHGFQVFSKIPVYVSQDGTFSASLFDGDYKLVQLRGNGPWTNKSDSVDVKVRGAITVDMPVTPYFTITNTTFQKNGTAITASGKVNKIATSDIERVTLYLGTTTIVDATNNAGVQDKTGTALADLSQPVSFSLAIPASLATRDYVYARIGVKTAGVGEMVYSVPQKVALK